MSDRIQEKLSILADAAKYDVSCASSGSDRKIKIKAWVMQAMVFAMLILKMGVVFPY